jgi:putative CRISPR-associated protein (TIGR02619 family)
MNPLFVTVGTSAVENAEIGSAHRKSNERLRKDVNDFLSDTDEYKDEATVWLPLRDELVDAHEAFWKLDKRWIRDKNHYRQTSAELLSTYLLVSDNAFEFDRIVLLASQTAEGRFSAHVNRLVFSSAAYQAKLGSKREVTIREIPGLNETIREGNAVGVLRDILLDQTPNVIRVNMTGAYKGVAATLGFIAGKEARRKVHLYYLHEDSARPGKVISEENYAGPMEGGSPF